MIGKRFIVKVIEMPPFYSHIALRSDYFISSPGYLNEPPNATVPAFYHKIILYNHDNNFLQAFNFDSIQACFRSI